jgi:hypothetical protein
MDDGKGDDDEGAAADELQTLLSGPGLAVAKAQRSDVIVFHGEITVETSERCIALVPAKADRAKDVLMALVTPGGDADAAFRIARNLQNCYEKFTILVPGACKSAGTLLATGAHRIVMGTDGELGPLDVQLLKPDDLFERTSGLAADAAMDLLEQRAIRMYNRFVTEILTEFGPRLSVKTASHTAATLVSELMGRVYAQFDPMKMGENYRQVRVAQHYCEQLEVAAQNFVSGEAIALLINYFPSHTTVIDRPTARQMFKRVDQPDEIMQSLIVSIRRLIPRDQTQASIGLVRPGGQVTVDYI